jgi:hypothetical protein
MAKIVLGRRYLLYVPNQFKKLYVCWRWGVGDKEVQREREREREREHTNTIYIFISFPHILLGDHHFAPPPSGEEGHIIIIK